MVKYLEPVAVFDWAIDSEWDSVHAASAKSAAALAQSARCSSVQPRGNPAPASAALSSWRHV
eukprot:CAMPEP_0183317752 /NCGR_PEP_ID=MMETSP0160_2-20130417/58827_1 /TAXON_ID=2839 ORGANISM="Odontella Sinensis, Strain Grunow 1884" /NCGR_SAMPLE_ID=MMETSP0160_2 /ASSEMBLY_ACC=CAM_ASM_000250 /LENGTH=61 /DNA_ID=CAMNT_0025483849 /DNA_START=125 /DNA_END=310 /DNA_ORIENTATION=-